MEINIVWSLSLAQAVKAELIISGNELPIHFVTKFDPSVKKILPTVPRFASFI